MNLAMKFLASKIFMGEDSVMKINIDNGIGKI